MTLAIALSLSISGLLAFGVKGLNDNHKPTEPQVSDIDPDILLSETNRLREVAGARPLQVDERLNRSAQAKCDDMVERDYWSHKSPDGTYFQTLLEAQNVEFARAGENLLNGNTDAVGVVKAWSESPKHNKTMLDKRYTSVGFGVCESSDYLDKGGQVIVVQHLAV